ncbi:hypothetical protein EC991_000886 [Linnemannia zychae]|nr:hypothetical protein EC991_000886 [Linnemannia zychae]
MSNPAVAKWLEEIAAIKAKAQAKEQQQQQEQKQKQEQQQHSIESNKERQDRNPQQPSSSIGKTTATATTAQYGIIPSFNLRTRKKQLRLVLPPEPRKPGPGECCGNDCEPCVNTIYWEDLEAHRNKYRELQRQFEEECRHLESEESVSTDKAVIGTDGHRELQVNEEEDVEGEGDDGAEMSIRSYRPFVVLLKEYLSENTLLVVCDLPYSSQKKKRRNSRPSRTRTNQETMFHVLIRFQQQEDGQFLTRAFTPIDLSRIHTPKVEAKVARGASGRGSSSVGEGLKYRTVEEIGRGFEDRMAFLVKLYPSPHATSDMFRALEVCKHYTRGSGS